MCTLPHACATKQHWPSQRTHHYLLNLPIILLGPPVTTLVATTTPEQIYLQLLEAHQKIRLIYLVKYADHGSAELMI